MLITRVEAIPVRVPLKPGMVTKTAHGDHHTSDYVIVKVHTDEGIVGLGEATVSALWSGETSKSCAAALDDLIGPALIGADPTQITALRQRMDFLIKLNPFTKSAVEMALWDISRKGPWSSRLSAPGRQGARGDPDEDDDRRVRAAPRSVAGRAIPGLGRALPEGESRARPGGRSGTGSGRPKRGRPRYSNHRRRQLRMERDHSAGRARPTATV